jgi:hypothetical protein
LDSHHNHLHHHDNLAMPSRDEAGHSAVPLHISPPTSITNDTPDLGADADDNDAAAAAGAAATAGDSPTAPPPEPPALLHHLNHDSPVLAVAVSEEAGLVYVGTADGVICAWSLDTFALVRRVQAHKRAVLCLALSSSSSAAAAAAADPPAQTILISSAGDAIINVWDPRTFCRLYEVYGLHDVGDIFCVAHSVRRDTVYIGAQNTSIQWARLDDPRLRTTHASDSHPDRRNHRFFDSKAVGGTSTPRRNDERWAHMPRARHVVEMDRGSLQAYAHYGFVLCMLVARAPTVLVDADEDVLISGGGDGTIKLWRLGTVGAEPSQSKPWMAEGDETIEEIMTLGEDDAESVLSLAVDGSFLYGGKLRGIVELWDLDTKQKLRVIKAQEGDITAMQLAWGGLWTASRSGHASVSGGSCRRRVARTRATHADSFFSSSVTAPSTRRTRARRRRSSGSSASSGGRPTRAGSSRPPPCATTTRTSLSPAPTTTWCRCGGCPRSAAARTAPTTSATRTRRA